MIIKLKIVDQTLKDKISKTRNETRERRSHMVCKTYCLKIDCSRLNNKQKESLKMMFVEAKWLYNHWLREDDIFNADAKIKEVIVKNRIIGNFEKRTLKFLPAKCKQSIRQSLKESIYTLSQSKKHGHKIGRLQFKKEFKTLILNQYIQGEKSGTHELRNRKFFISGIGTICINGLNQLPKKCEFGRACLTKKPSGYYIHIVTYSKPIVEEGQGKEKLKEVGLDFGIKEMITTSDGEVFNQVSVQEPEHLKRLQQKLSRSKKGSKNRYKIKFLIQKEYEKLNNKKEDVANKIVYKLFSEYEKIYIQDDNFNGWKTKGKHWSKRIHHSILGRIKEKLIQKGAIVINRFLPTTKTCYKCKNSYDVQLSERIFRCPSCGLIEPRDVKAAKTILMFGNGSLKFDPKPTERRCQPVETKTSVSRSKYRNISLVNETGRSF
ncbi:MAG: transposase [Patescibacteria group bacterium]